MNSLSCVALAISDQCAPDLVGPTSPLYGFSSSDDVSAIPHGSTGVPHRASEPQPSTAQQGSNSDHVKARQPSFGTNGGEHGAQQRPPTSNATSGPPQSAVSPEYTAYVQPQRPNAPPRFSAHDHQQHNGYHHAQMSPLQFPGFDQPNMAGHPQQPPWYPPASGYGTPGTPAGQGEIWPCVQQQHSPPYQTP